MIVTNEEQRGRRINQIVMGLKKRIKRKGDSIFRRVVEITGDGDYLEGKDSGEPPVSYERL